MFARWIKNHVLPSLGVAVAACSGGGGGDDGVVRRAGEHRYRRWHGRHGIRRASGGADRRLGDDDDDRRRKSAQAPALPAGVTVFGPIFAFTARYDVRRAGDDRGAVRSVAGSARRDTGALQDQSGEYGLDGSHGRR
jgi:hypothetical protein